MSYPKSSVRKTRLMSEDEDKNHTSGPKRRLSDSEFVYAKEQYELGKLSLADIAKELSVSRQTLSKRFIEAGVQKGSRSHELTTAAAIAQKATVERFAERRAEMIEETRLTGLNALKQTRMIGQKIVVDQMKAGKPLGEVDDDLKALTRFNRVLVDNISTALRILQADEHIDEADLPILTIEDLTDEDILNHHKSTGALDEDATIEDINLEIHS
jgi:DNA-binding XRE family transcriptional regulator